MGGQGKRRSRRVTISQPAALTDFVGARIATCELCDVSEGGAGLKLDSGQPLPDEFQLVLAERVRQTCTLVWRSKNRLGVCFAANEAAPSIVPAETAGRQAGLDDGKAGPQEAKRPAKKDLATNE